VNVAIDSSIVLRIAFGESGAWTDWGTHRLIASTLLFVECVRSIDRARLAGAAPPSQLARFRHATEEAIENIQLVDITAPVLARAAQAFRTPIRTLDAIHLATAIEWRERNMAELAFATHDRQLATAARAAGFTVLGA
jgi:predicted nucleic acid-binding protein